MILLCIRVKETRLYLLTLHFTFKGECNDCTEANVCRPREPTNPKAFRKGGRMNKRMARLNGIWKYPVCDRDGEVKFDSLCDFHMARCEAVKDDDEQLPEGGSEAKSFVFATFSCIVHYNALY